ncbi:MAG: alpha/beta hydrolase, partial [Nocardioidaceae bacterium]
DLDRLEYRLIVTDRTGSTHVECDPGNPTTVTTAFGDRSVALLPGYTAPGWLEARVAPGTTTNLTYQAEDIGELPIAVWAAEGLPTETSAPLLVCHDGPEYAVQASLTRCAAAMVAAGTLPPFRIALMQPVSRDDWYSANPTYTAAELAALDLVATHVSVGAAPVVMGASLGGLCALVTALAAQPRFAGVFTQSGSFFTRALDPQESTYPYFERVVEVVEEVTASPAPDHVLRIGMTCGALEENFANNAELAAVLSSHGHHVDFRTLRDLHNYVAWRDALHPALTDLLRSVWARCG